MTGDSVTHVATAVLLAAGGSNWIVIGGRGLVTGQMTPRLARMALGRGGFKDPTATAIFVVFFGIGFLTLGVGRLAAGNVLFLVAVALVAFGTVLGLLRDRHARRTSPADQAA